MHLLETTSSDGLKLCGRQWESSGEAKAAVYLIHGLGEHIGRYDHVAEALNATGYSVIGFDLRGHGKSEGQRGHTPAFDILLDDIFQTLELTKERFPLLPLFLYGHSLGGGLAIYYALKRKTELAGVIASAPLLRLAYQPPKWKQKLLNTLHALHINLSIPSGLDDTALSRDVNVIRSYRNDPLTHRVITPSLASGMVKAGVWSMEHASEFPCPLLLIHGDADRITSADATRAFSARVPGDCTLNLLPGVFHEPHNEPERNEVVAAIIQWLENHTNRRTGRPK